MICSISGFTTVGRPRRPLCRVDRRFSDTRPVECVLLARKRFCWSNPMPLYRQLGSLPRKRHIAHRHEPGFRNEGIYYEEVVTTAGFGRAYSIAYHLRPPTRVRKVEAAGQLSIEFAEEPALRHHHLKSGHMKPAGDPITGRVPLLVNDNVSIARCRPIQA